MGTPKKESTHLFIISLYMCNNLMKYLYYIILQLNKLTINPNINADTNTNPTPTQHKPSTKQTQAQTQCVIIIQKKRNV
tara:strand:+ start:906 stop:1142 length:237 start_codon:yes stop_codon:yes gene_type:complete